MSKTVTSVVTTALACVAAAATFIALKPDGAEFQRGFNSAADQLTQTAQKELSAANTAYKACKVATSGREKELRAQQEAKWKADAAKGIGEHDNWHTSDEFCPKEDARVFEASRTVAGLKNAITLTKTAKP